MPPAPEAGCSSRSRVSRPAPTRSGSPTRPTPNRGQATFLVDGGPVGGTLDQYAASSSYPTATIATVTFTAAGSHTFRMTVRARTRLRVASRSPPTRSLSSDSRILPPRFVALDRTLRIRSGVQSNAANHIPRLENLMNRTLQFGAFLAALATVPLLPPAPPRSAASAASKNRP